MISVFLGTKKELAALGRGEMQVDANQSIPSILGNAIIESLIIQKIPRNRPENQPSS